MLRKFLSENYEMIAEIVGSTLFIAIITAILAVGGIVDQGTQDVWNAGVTEMLDNIN